VQVPLTGTGLAAPRLPAVVVAFALATFVSTLCGGWVAVHANDRLHLVLGFAAGVLLGVVGFDLLPEAFAQTHTLLFGVPGPMITFAAGFLGLHVLERSAAVHRGHEEEYGGHHHQPAVGLIAASSLVLHSVMDGLGLGLAFQAGNGIGVAVAIAVVSHDFADGFNTYTITSLYGNNRRRATLLLFLDAAAPLVGALLTLLFSIPEHALGWYLGFFAGFLLYLATGDILPEAHARHPSRLTVVCTVAGVGFIWLVVGLSS
jgi:zinc and cadmium transporter